MDGCGVYLYCFARAGGTRDVAAAGVDGGNGLATLERRGVAAVFSRVPLEEFTGEPGATNLQNPHWVIPRVCQHERVVEEVMCTSPVLPVRFGAVFSSQQTLAELLARRAEEIGRFLDRISDKEEWAVKGFADLDRAGTWLLGSDPVLAEQWQRLPESPGTRYLAEKRLRADAHRRARSSCRALAAEVQDELSRRAVDVRPLKPQPTERSETNAEMVFNGAFLLLRERAEEFRSHVARIDARYADRGLTVTISGPWPPYNFCPALGGTSP